MVDGVAGADPSGVSSPANAGNVSGGKKSRSPTTVFCLANGGPVLPTETGVPLEDYGGI